MLQKIIKNKNQIIELIVIFIITIFYNLICSNISGDEIWNYGFSYNISTGLIPYKDFNMIITPLFPLLGALFLSIFGKSFLVYHIFNSIVCTIIFYFLKKHINQNSYIVYLFLLMNSYPSYNLLCILLLYILIQCEDKKSNDYLIGILLGLTFITKQNIGVYLCIPTIFTKDIKKILKRFIGFLIPNLMLLVYLISTDSLSQFINYTIMGISSFTKDNTSITITTIIIFLISTIYLIYKYIKTKDITIIYLIMFQLLAFPLADKYHLIIAIIPVIGYILKNIKIPKIIPITFFIVFIVSTFLININLITKENILFPNDTKTFIYKKISPKINDYIVTTSNVIKKINKDDIKLYIIGRDAYLIKLESSIPINKYDLLNSGNLGKEGEKGIINDIEKECNNKKCVFLLELETPKTINYAKEVKEYIKENYSGGNIVECFYVYKNY